MDPNELRRLDFSLSEEQEAIRELFADFFEKQSPTTIVREAEPTGFDQKLWEQLIELGVTQMGVPEDRGGDGVGISELAIIAEEFGRTLAPVPLLEHIVATRLLAQVNDESVNEVLAGAMDGTRILGIATEPLVNRGLVSTAAVAADIVAFDGDSLIIVSSENRTHVPNQASLPYAWVDPHTEGVAKVSSSNAAELYDIALRELKTLTAAALVGLTEAALKLSLEFVKSRETMGISIGALQGVSFPLVDVSIGISGSRNLAYRAAWFLDHEPEAEPWLQASALVRATETATVGVTTAQHMQGGLGFTVEADASLYFLRAKGWALAAGNPRDDSRRIGELRINAAA
ncbi:acyl-CoA dehydrogenase family protein [Leucobacter denitrificans]|uniref:Acyl-CoA dehydrogenase family protein n=1 Tax=Leucobacter denitrificans TaxID=683042 RepID=A0A7G9S557_9MICO|nr:acyl-CoA dehydrogenase family protein [Leucobacter denitrificans]QNN62982.1 acyl-CoA dehydrogenase family protein [Leucobacter denitrificans]